MKSNGIKNITNNKRDAESKKGPEPRVYPV